MSSENASAQPGKKKKPLLVLLLTIITLLSGAMAAYTWYEMKEVKASLNPGEKKEEVKKIEPVIPVYLPMETFTVSLQPDEHEEDRVLYIGLTLRLADEESKALIEQFMPEVRSRLLVVLSQQKARELSGDADKVRLINQIKEVIRQPLSPEQSANVTDVLFNAFIIR